MGGPWQGRGGQPEPGRHPKTARGISSCPARLSARRGRGRPSARRRLSGSGPVGSAGRDRAGRRRGARLRPGARRAAWRVASAPARLDRARHDADRCRLSLPAGARRLRARPRRAGRGAGAPLGRRALGGGRGRALRRAGADASGSAEQPRRALAGGLAAAPLALAPCGAAGSRPAPGRIGGNHRRAPAASPGRRPGGPRARSGGTILPRRAGFRPRCREIPRWPSWPIPSGVERP